jgi:hypothetical protein
MSKKLIAVASATALALSALVGIAPASATVTLGVANSDGGSGTSTEPYLIAVPETNKIETANGIEFTATASEGDVMTVTATGGVRIVSSYFDASNPAKLFTSASGTQSYTATITSTASTKVFVVYNTSTTAGTFQVSLKSATSSATGSPVHVKGVKGAAYNYTMTAPASIPTGVAGELTFTVTDAFGNAIEDDNTEKSTIHSAVTIAGVSAPSKGGAVSWDSSRKVYFLSIAAQSTTTPFGVTMSVTVTDIGGLADAKKTAYAAINSAANTTATAQIAALTAQLAESRPKAKSVTKKRFNTLARKWNAAFPSQKVKLKK